MQSSMKSENISILETGFVICKNQYQVDELAKLAEAEGYKSNPSGTLFKHGMDHFTLIRKSSYAEKMWILCFNKVVKNSTQYQFTDFINQ